jgi:hypothetical protein
MTRQKVRIKEDLEKFQCIWKHIEASQNMVMVLEHMSKVFRVF